MLSFDPQAALGDFALLQRWSYPPVLSGSLQEEAEGIGMMYAVSILSYLRLCLFRVRRLGLHP